MYAHEYPPTFGFGNIQRLQCVSAAFRSNSCRQYMKKSRLSYALIPDAVTQRCSQFKNPPTLWVIRRVDPPNAPIP